MGYETRSGGIYRNSVSVIERKGFAKEPLSATGPPRVGRFGSRGAAEFIATRVASVLIFGGLLVACGGSETSSDLEAEESQFGSSTEQAELPEGPFGEVAVDLGGIIKPTDNVGGEVQNYIDFPDVHTPEGAQPTQH